MSELTKYDVKLNAFQMGFIMALLYQHKIDSKDESRKKVCDEIIAQLDDARKQF